MKHALTMPQFRDSVEYEQWIVRYRLSRIERFSKKIALNAHYGALRQPQKDIRCHCPMCKELWKS